MICYQCFQDKGDNLICPYCQYNDASQKERFPMALPAGIEIGGAYTLGRVLGQGGFGITYIAKDNANGKRVAVKEYFPDSMATRTDSRTVRAHTGERGEAFAYGKKCFLDEAKTLAAFMGTPGIVRVFRYFEENGTAYFVMEYIEGKSLKDYLRSSGGKISFAEACRILIPVMDALAVVHSKGIVHRDISPDNIIITKKGKVKLLDFGAARYSIGDMSRSLDVVLKHGYAPREQYSRHGRQGPFTDVYSLAATFYRSITGIIPQDSIDRMDEDMLITPRAFCPDLTPQGEYAIYKGMAIQPTDRFQSTTLFKECLLSLGQTPPAHFKPAPQRVQPPVQRQQNVSSGQMNRSQPSGSASGKFYERLASEPNRSAFSNQQPRPINPPVNSADPQPRPINPPVNSANPQPRSFNPPVNSADPQPRSFNPPPVMNSQPPVQNFSVGKGQAKSKKPFSPLKTFFASFGISLAVFGAILLIIILTR